VDITFLGFVGLGGAGSGFAIPLARGLPIFLGLTALGATALGKAEVGKLAYFVELATSANDFNDLGIDSGTPLPMRLAVGACCLMILAIKSTKPLGGLGILTLGFLAIIIYL
jgi:hypothetical protein